MSMPTLTLPATAAREIPLTGGFVAIVDEADYAAVMAAGPWHATPPRGGRVYAQRHVRGARRQKTTQKLHTFLTGWSEVDHRDRDGLNNRRSNLREATRTQNNANMRLRSDSTSGYKGVSWLTRERLWCARIHVHGRRIHLGGYHTAEDAALAYDRAAREHFGEFARVNFPDHNDADGPSTARCARSHEFSRDRAGRRLCRICKSDSQREHRARLRAKEGSK